MFQIECFNTASVLIQLRNLDQSNSRNVVSIQLLFLFNGQHRIQHGKCTGFNTASVLIQHELNISSADKPNVSIQLLFLFNINFLISFMINDFSFNTASVLIQRIPDSSATKGR